MKYVLVLFAIMLSSPSVFKANADDNCPIDLWFFCIEGITLRYGVNQQIDEFGDIQCNPNYTVNELTGEKTILSDLGSCFWDPYISTDTSINQQSALVTKGDSIRFPVGIETPENLLSSWRFSQWYLDFDISDDLENLPPVGELIEFDENRHYLRQKTRVRETLKEKFFTTTELDLINNNISYSNWALSADYTRRNFALGYMYGFFIPIGEFNRLFKLGVGIGFQIQDYQIKINLCQNYQVTRNDISETPRIDSGQCVGKKLIEKAVSANNSTVNGAYKFVLFERRKDDLILRIFSFTNKETLEWNKQTQGSGVGATSFPKVQFKTHRDTNWHVKTKMRTLDILSYTFLF